MVPIHKLRLGIVGFLSNSDSETHFEKNSSKKMEEHNRVFIKTPAPESKNVLHSVQKSIRLN